jgi:hypothetical protein
MSSPVVLALALLAAAVATTEAWAQAQPASGAASASVQPDPKALDAIPANLYEKMFSSNKLVGSPGLAWKRKRTLTVAFNGGSEPLYRLIEESARDWTSIGGQLKFSFTDTAGKYRVWSPKDKTVSADIRIGFDQRGYWSLLGVLAQNVGPGDPTMNFGGFPTDLHRYFDGKNAAEWKTSYERGTVLHEFGHALGLSHEHFNPKCQQDLKIEEAVASLMAPPNGWSYDQARFNIDAKYYAEVLKQQAGPLESKLLTSPNTDQQSQMLYSFGDKLYKSGAQSVCKPVGDHGQPWPTVLSDGDKAFYLDNYRVISSPFGPAGLNAARKE